MHKLFIGTEETFQKIKVLRSKEGVSIFVIEDRDVVRKRIIEILAEVFPCATIDVLERGDFLDIETHLLRSTHDIIFLDNILSEWPSHPRFKQLGILLAPFIKERTGALLGFISNDPVVNQLAFSKHIADFAITKDDFSMFAEIMS